MICVLHIVMHQATQADIEPIEDNAEYSFGQEAEVPAVETGLDETIDGSIAGEAG